MAFKLQGFVNDPTRGRDLDDIKALLRAHHEALDLDALAGYFRLFDHEDLLDELIREARG